ncbi:DUF6214 family protein [Streptomyces sp. NPDC005423]|uniref:DUF6214 family protein n=1 Tax=Streptomyces sp. NPDC005423 TaxID=3155343 RepID=UPI0033A2C15D
MSVWPAWEVRERDGVTSWFHVRLLFADGARVDALAVVSAEAVSVEDVRARPALSLDDLTALAEWIETPLFEACGPHGGSVDGEDAGSGGAHRARAAWPRGIEGCRLVAQEYLAAQGEGADPVLAVMCATGHSRRRSLGLISRARDAGLLTPRHVKR